MFGKQFKIIGLGEVLWDVLPTGKQVGGAPANFAFVAAQLGDCGIVASRVGKDASGAEITQRLQSFGVETSAIQIDETHVTGSVEVSLENGQPRYSIVESVAWDFLELSAEWQALAVQADAICFGTLAQRNAASQKTISDFLALTNPAAQRVFDVNLRQSFYSKKILANSFRLANVAKLNHEELSIIANFFEIDHKNQIECAARLREKFDLRLVCVTRGATGSLLVAENQISEHAGVRVTVKDTIGAGDAFTATMTHGLLRGWSLDEINEKANRVGGFVASQTGAMPVFALESI